MAASSPRTCDVLIRNGCILTMDAQRSILAGASIAITGNEIAAVGSDRKLASYNAHSVIDAGGAIVHPGYVDAHLHVNAQTCRGFFRGDASKGAGGGPKY